MRAGGRAIGGGGLLLVAVLAGRAYAAPCDTPPNAIVAENCLPGDPPSTWDVSGAGDPDIVGFTTDISVNRGGTVVFKIDTDATAYRLDIYRMGYYGGLGARRVATVAPAVALPQLQPVCLSDAATGLVDCGNWAPSAAWTVPPGAVSGIYFAKLVREDAVAGENHVVFVVRDDSGGSALLFQTSDTTWQAYNQYGGNSLYAGAPAGRAYKVSYNRPFTTRGPTPEDWVFNAEYPMVRWLEANGFDVSYTAGVDTARRGGELLEHQVFLSVGHDEYWSGEQRANVEAARDAGVHLAFFSGNEVFWKTRWEPSIDGSATAHRTLVTYKETHANAKIDPLPGVWTGTWRDPRFSPPADGQRPENGLTGTIFTVNCCTYPMTVPQADGRMRLWRDTSVAALGPARSRPSDHRPWATSGRGPRQRLPAGRCGADVEHDRDRSAAHPRPRLDLRPGNRDAPPGAAPACERRPRLRRRHRAMVVGTRPGPRSRRRPRRRPDAAGDAQPAGRHGRAAGHPPAWPGGGERVGGRHRAIGDAHRAGGRRRGRERCDGGDHRDGGRRGRGRRRRRRGVGRRGRDLAPGLGTSDLDLPVGGADPARAGHAAGPCGRRQREPGRPGRSANGDRRRSHEPERGTGRSDPRGHARRGSLRTLPCRGPPRGGAERVRRRRHRDRVRDHARGLRCGRPRPDAAHPRAGDDADRMGDGRRQPDRAASRRAARRVARADARGDDAGERLSPGPDGVGPGRGPGERDHPVPRRRRSLHAVRCHGRGDALRHRDHRDAEPGGHAPERRHARRPGGGVRLRPRSLGGFHAPGQPGVGRAGA